MSPRYVAVRGSATADSVCVMHPALEASMDLIASVTITPVSASVGSSVEATGCVTAGSVTVRAAGQGSIVTAAPALRRACQRMALSAADGGDVSVVTVSALYLEHLGTGVRSAQRVETPVAPQGPVSSAICKIRMMPRCVIKSAASLKFLSTQQQIMTRALLCNAS